MSSRRQFRNPKWKDRDKKESEDSAKSRSKLPSSRRLMFKRRKKEERTEDSLPDVSDISVPEDDLNQPNEAIEDQSDGSPDSESERLNSSGNKRGLHLTPERAREIRKRRTFYPRLTPKLACDTCAYTASCPKYRPGYECAFLPFLKQHKIRSLEDLKQAALAATEADAERLQISLILERLSGTIIPEVSLHLEGFMRRLSMTKGMLEDFADRSKHVGPVEMEEDGVTVKGKPSVIAELFQYRPDKIDVEVVSSEPVSSESENPENELENTQIETDDKDSKESEEVQ